MMIHQVARLVAPFAFVLLLAFVAIPADGQIAYDWKPTTGRLPGLDGAVNALIEYDDGTGPAIYAAGDFRLAGDLPVHNIVKWNGQAWSTLGTGDDEGVGGRVGAMIIYHGELVVSGLFDNGGAIQGTQTIAKWNGSSWSTLGTDMPSVTYDVDAMLIYHDDLIVGGHFRTPTGLLTKYIAKWDGTSWSALGTGSTNGLNGQIHAMTEYNGDLIVGGNFTTAGGSEAIGIAR